MDFMGELPDKAFDLALVDPPYGIKRDEGFEGFGGFGTPIARKKYKGWGDEQTPDKNYFDLLLRISHYAIIFGGQFFTDKLPKGGHWIFWDKKNTMPTFGDGELAWTNFERTSVKQITLEWNGLLGKEKHPRIHATQKPIALYEWLLKNYAKAGDKILDTHVGSGSSRIAAWKHGYDFTGYELDADYYAAQEKRFQDYISQERMFPIEQKEVEQIKIL